MEGEDSADFVFAGQLGGISETPPAVSPLFARQQRLFDKRRLVADWLYALTGATVPADNDEAFRSALGDGVTLCKLLNVLQPGTIPRVIECTVDSSTGEVIQTFENVTNFIKACQAFTGEVFSARDLEDEGERPQVVECLMSLRDWQLAAQQGAAMRRSLSLSPTKRSPMGGGSPALSLRSAGGSPVKSPPVSGHGSFSFTPIAQDFVQKHGTRTAQPDGGIPQLMRSCTNMLKSKMGMPATPPMPRAGGALPTETALEAVGPVLESVLANLTAEYEKRLLAKDQEMKLSHEAMDRMRKQIAVLQDEVAYWQSTAANVKALPAHPTDGLTDAEREEYEERIRAEREAAQQKLQEAEVALLEKESELHASLQEKDAELEELREELEKAADIQQRLAEVREENRMLYNTVQDLRGNIRVFCRIRPSGATGDSSQMVVDEVDQQQLRLYNPKTSKDSIFKFDRVFGENSTQEEVYEETKPLIRSVLDGYNVCIFAYGQTGSGKTHTMSGTDVQHYEGRGINYRALDDLFAIQEQRSSEVEYDIRVQMLEIYNENLRDLLVDEAEARQQRSLELRDTQRSGNNVPDAIQLPVGCTEDVLKVMELGQRNRAVAETRMNERSSRSHSVLTVTVNGTNLITHEKTHGCLHLIDLAGSERISKSGAEGEQLKEATHINTSLSALGQVMTCLASKAKHVPFRNSKLTRLLEDSLSGQAKSMMFIHVAPEWNSASESKCTLEFGKRVTEVTLGAAKKNTESAVAYEAKELERKLRQEQQRAAEHAQRAEQEAQQRLRLEAELEQLRAQLSRQALSSGSSSPSSASEGEMIRAYRPAPPPAAAARLTPGASRRLPTPGIAGLPRPDSSASGSSTPAGSRALTPRSSGDGSTPRGLSGKPASLSRLNLAAVEKEAGGEKLRSGLRGPSMGKLNLERLHSSEENTPQSARSNKGLSKIPTPASGSLTARALPKASPGTSIPRPHTARESPDEAKARRSAVGLVGPKPTAAAANSRLSKPSVSQLRNSEASARILGRGSSSSLNADGSLNSARSIRSSHSGSFGRSGRWS